MKRPEFTIVGYKIRTTNENNQAMYDIPLVWEKVAQESFFQNIPDRSNDEITGLYYEYEKDHTKPYSFLLGVPVSCITEIPNGMETADVPEQDYQIFPAEGPMPDVLIHTWQEIWQSPAQRAYTFDFERYTPESFSEHPKLDIWIS